MFEPKTNDNTIICDCGHPLRSHSSGARECYTSTRRTEKRKNHFGKIIKVKCVYVCYCKKFEFKEYSESVHITSKEESNE